MNQSTLTTDYIIQYTIVGIILLAACVWIVVKMARKQKNTGGSCCGCTLADTCKKKNLKTEKHKDGKNSNFQ